MYKWNINILNIKNFFIIKYIKKGNLEKKKIKISIQKS